VLVEFLDELCLASSNFSRPVSQEESADPRRPKRYLLVWLRARDPAVTPWVIGLCASGGKKEGVAGSPSVWPVVVSHTNQALSAFVRNNLPNCRKVDKMPPCVPVMRARSFPVI
jgi:hypothetical protein